MVYETHLGSIADEFADRFEGLADAYGKPSKEVLSLFEWTQRYRHFLWPDVPLDFKHHSYLKELYQNPHERMVIMKCAQMGLSEWAVSLAFWMTDEMAGNVLYVLPTMQDVNDFSATRVGLAIEASPYLMSITSDKTDRLALKRIRNRYLYFRWGGVKVDGRAHQLKVTSADLLIMDELDECDSRALPIARKRLLHSSLAWEVMISTPTIPDYGIHHELGDSDFRLWHVRCPRCGERQPLDPFVNLILETDASYRPIAWYGMEKGEPFVGCRKCHKPIDQEELQNGEWVPQFPSRNIRGYHINRLMTPLADLDELIRTGQTYDETERREWLNQDLGLPYQPSGGSFMGIMDTYSFEPPKSAFGACMGVDVGTRLHVVVRDWTRDGDGNMRRRLLWVGEVDQFDQLGPLMIRYDVRMCIIDFLPETREATRFAAKWPGRVKLALYVGGPQALADSSTREVRGSEYVLNVDRTRTLDALRAAYASRSMQDFVHVPKDFHKHHEAMVRLIEERGGNPIARWVSSGADHYAHANNYCNIALEMSSLSNTSEAVMVEQTDDFTVSAWWR